MSELKPCPFCGYENPYFAHNVECEPNGIVCMKCHTIVRFMRIKVRKGERFQVAMDKMAEIWNTRTEVTE